MSIAEWQEKVHALAKEKGWWDGVAPGDPCVVPEKIALVHSELSEALEVYRQPDGAHGQEVYDGQRPRPLREPVYMDEQGRLHNRQCALGQGDVLIVRKPTGFDSEVADVVIRVMDLCGHLGIDLERAIREKHAFNETRTRRHGGKRC